MKSILQGPKEKAKEDSKYPYLGIWLEGGLVVLFESPEKGTLVHEVLPKPIPGHDIHGVGRVDRWGEKESFVPLTGKIILSN